MLNPVKKVLKILTADFYGYSAKNTVHNKRKQKHDTGGRVSCFCSIKIFHV